MSDSTATSGEQARATAAALGLTPDQFAALLARTLIDLLRASLEANVRAAALPVDDRETTDGEDRAA